MKYKIIYDNGKPSEILVNSEAELRAELNKIFIDIRTDFYAYADLIILDENDNDITTSPAISLIICDIQNTREEQAQAEKNISKIARGKK